MKSKAIAVLSVLLAAYFGLNGVLKLVGHPHMVESFTKWGYSTAFMLGIGVVELLAGAALAVPRLAPAGAAVLLSVMVGALGTHVTHGESAHALIPLAVMPLLAIVGIVRGDRFLPRNTVQSKAPADSPFADDHCRDRDLASLRAPLREARREPAPWSFQSDGASSRMLIPFPIAQR